MCACQPPRSTQHGRPLVGQLLSKGADTLRLGREGLTVSAPLKEAVWFYKCEYLFTVIYKSVVNV